MSQIFLGQLSPGEIQLRERESQYQRQWGGGVSLAERLGFVMQFQPGDVVMLIDAYNHATAVRAEVEGALDWGAYQVRVLEGPRAGESIVVNWAAVTPIGPGFTESKPKERQNLQEAKAGSGGVLRLPVSQLAEVNVLRRAKGLPELKLRKSGRMSRLTLTWGHCDRCGGDLPLVGGDNDAAVLPVRLKYRGDCPGHLAPEGLCGAYEGWGRARIERYVRRRGVRIE